MRNRKPSLLIVLFALAVSSASCSVLQNLQDMHDQTAQLANLTKTLLSENGDLRDKASEAYSFQTRHFAIEEMERAKTQTAKLKAAAAYVVAFGFQGWNNIGNDSQQSLDDDLLVAAQEFLRGMVEYMAPADSRKTSPTASDPRSMDLYALSAVLQEIGTDQTDLDRASGRPAISLLSILQDALLDNYNKVLTLQMTADQLPPWENEVLTHYPDIVYLMEVRAGFLVGMFLAQVSDIQRTGFLGIPGLVLKLEMLLHPWQALTPELNDSSLKSFTTFMHGSNLTRSFLASIGEKFTMDGQLMKILRNMRIPAEPQASASRAALLADLQSEITTALGSSNLAAEFTSSEFSPPVVRPDGE